MLTRTYVFPDGLVEWSEFVDSGFEAIYNRIIDNDERLAVISGHQMLYLMPAAAFAPRNFSEQQIEDWVHWFEDDLQVGPTFVQETYEEPVPGSNVGIIHLRL
jgi:hypothetical protein